MSVSSAVARNALLVVILAVPLSAGAALTLAEAERLALDRAPWYQHHRTNVSAAAERIEYEGRLPDPQLTVGVVNVPTTTYDLRSEDMTMTMVGVRQSFPPGDTLNLRSQRARQELTREEARLEMERRNLLRQVRNGWLELYYLDRSLALLDRSRVLQHGDQGISFRMERVRAKIIKIKKHTHPGDYREQTDNRHYFNQSKSPHSARASRGKLIF